MSHSKPAMSLADWHQRFQQQSHWTKSIRRHLFEKANLKSGERILEVGSGTSAVLSQVAAENQCRTYGIDIDFKSLGFSQKRFPGALLTQADAHHLPFQDNVFSITYCHYLLMWVHDPLKVLMEMHRVTRFRGNVIALAESDYATRIDYPPPLDRLGDLQTKALESQGADTQIGRKLGALLNQAGLSDIEVGIIGAQWQSEATEDIDETEWKTLYSDLDNVLTQTELVKYKKLDLQARERSERILFIPTFYAMGTVK
jgi:SAM-dependent methyltransferase